MATYLPAKDDPIDKKLADFIANYPENLHLKSMFYRETPGIYNFGSKKVFAKVEQEKLLLRVGGGWLQVEEFVDQYLGQEVERMERREVSKKLSEDREFSE
jgi:hypothetical protein